MTFQISERSKIVARGDGYYKEHNELSDAMEKVVNWLAGQPVNTVVTITETTTVTKTAS